MTSLPAKTCTRCGELKTLTDYHKKSASADGHQNFCKPCDNAARAKYRAANREANTAYQLKYSADNRDRENLRKREWSANNPDYSSDYREKNKEAILAYGKDYAKNNRHIYSEAKRRRRARMLGNGVEVYTELQVLETYGTDCHICSGPVDLNNSRRVGHPGWETGLHIDHVIPISKGGPDVLDNVRPSHGQCNLKKNARVE